MIVQQVRLHRTAISFITIFGQAEILNEVSRNRTWSLNTLSLLLGSTKVIWRHIAA